VPVLEVIRERRERRGNDDHDQHAQDEAGQRAEDHRGDHQPEREQHLPCR
jgi:hypothetical protein